ncbi:MAG: phosphomannomutase, partial [Desulfovibrio sp.]|nr:phosphomannomutase [Desulfovibrio sp.]
MPDFPPCFKAYDIRGKAPHELNESFSYALGLALADHYQPVAVVLGHDVRKSSPGLHNALASALAARGAKVSTLGLCGTEEIYYASANSDNDLGIMVTGSHNPIDENGFKLVRRGSVPISQDSGLREIALKTAEYLRKPRPDELNHPELTHLDIREKWLDWLLGYARISRPDARKQKVVIDAGNGCAGPVLEALAPRLPVQIIPLNFKPDGSFPNGVPNPLLPERRRTAAKAVLENRADLGIAFDGDFDRCFFFNHRGEFVETCYLAGLLASQLLMAH